MHPKSNWRKFIAHQIMTIFFTSSLQTTQNIEIDSPNPTCAGIARPHGQHCIQHKVGTCWKATWGKGIFSPLPCVVPQPPLWGCLNLCLSCHGCSHSFPGLIHIQVHPWSAAPQPSSALSHPPPTLSHHPCQPASTGVN